jgi:hypothetical protein
MGQCGHYSLGRNWERQFTILVITERSANVIVRMNILFTVYSCPPRLQLVNQRTVQGGGGSNIVMIEVTGARTMLNSCQPYIIYTNRP